MASAIARKLALGQLGEMAQPGLMMSTPASRFAITCLSISTGVAKRRSVVFTLRFAEFSQTKYDMDG